MRNKIRIRLLTCKRQNIKHLSTLQFLQSMHVLAKISSLLNQKQLVITHSRGLIKSLAKMIKNVS